MPNAAEDFKGDQIGDSAPNNQLIASGSFNKEAPRTQLQLPDGQTVTLPTALLLYRDEQGADQVGSSAEIAPSSESEQIIPIVEERLTVEKRTVVTGKVLLEKHLQEYQEMLDIPLAVRSFDVERVLVNKPVQSAPPVRTEGGTTIYSLVEEQLVLTTQLILREEIHVTQRDAERRDTRTVTLTRETMEMSRRSTP